jgi:twinkle protein
VRGLIIDPYNELDHRRAGHVTETEFVSGMLTKIKRFAQHTDCHVWLVAHPRQLQDWRGEAPNLYDVSGRWQGGGSGRLLGGCGVGVDGLVVWG